MLICSHILSQRSPVAHSWTLLHRYLLWPSTTVLYVMTEWIAHQLLHSILVKTSLLLYIINAKLLQFFSNFSFPFSHVQLQKLFVCFTNFAIIWSSECFSPKMLAKGLGTRGSLVTGIARNQSIMHDRKMMREIFLEKNTTTGRKLAHIKVEQ